ncbi:MAG: GNAT family N-acetyltransferase [Planctomycetes bacterium]|nr:GNAT family N-acetyltransferase [Planctomycetota bacterium]
MRVRALEPTDSFTALTALLHAGYARLGALGLNYTAVDQDVETTRRRATRGACLVAELDGRLVGTLALWRGGPDEETERFRRADAFVLGQFAVDPAVQRRGVGAALLAEAERVARAAGAVEVLGDTAETATHLVEYYRRRGWYVVGSVHWPGKTYRSVLLAKAL